MSLTDLLEERLAVGAVELDLAALKALQHVVLVAVGEIGERLADIFRARQRDRAPPALRDTSAPDRPPTAGPGSWRPSWNGGRT